MRFDVYLAVVPEIEVSHRGSAFEHPFAFDGYDLAFPGGVCAEILDECPHGCPGVIELLGVENPRKCHETDYE